MPTFTQRTTHDAAPFSAEAVPAPRPAPLPEPPPRHHEDLGEHVTHVDHRPPPADVEPPPDPYEPPYDDGPMPDRAAPHDDAAERYVLGAALLSRTQLDTCAGIVAAHDFWQPSHETIWRALQHLAATDQPTEPQAVLGYLTDTRQAQKVGGAPYLFDLVEACSTPASAAYYATRVEQLARRRTAITELTRGLQRLTTPGDEADVNHVLVRTRDALTDAAVSLINPPTPTTWSPVDLAAVLAGDYLDPPPTMLMRSDGVYLLYDGAVHTIAGESESGKTWLTLIAALQLLEAGVRVIFIDFEDRADRVIGRLMALGSTPTQIRDNFIYIRPDRALDDDGRAQLAPHLPAAGLVILDGVTEAMNLHGLDLNSNADAATFYNQIPRWIADHGPAVVMIDHVVKDKEKQGRFALGAQHKLAGIDGVSYLVKMIEPFARGKRGLAKVTIAKDRPGHVREYAHGSNIAEFTLDATRSDVVLTAELTPPGQQSGRIGDTFEPTYLMEKISRYVQLNPGMSKKAIEGAMNGKATTIRLALELLVSHDYVGVKSGARGAVQHFHHKAYYADPETDPDAENTPPETDQTTHDQEAS